MPDIKRIKIKRGLIFCYCFPTAAAAADAAADDDT
jgi:hypothetical protein